MILVVDDDKNIRLSLKLILERIGGYHNFEYELERLKEKLK